jgi:Transglycosylase-like domain
MPKNRHLAVLGALTVLTPAPAAAEPTLRAPLAGEPTARAHMRDHQHDLLLDRLRKVAGERVDGARLWSNERLRREVRERRVAAQNTTASPQLEAIAACESGGDPTAIGGGGAFRGKYQFTYETWAAMGGSGDPAAAPEAEQDARAAKLLATAGPGQWPVCGQ